MIWKFSQCSLKQFSKEWDLSQTELIRNSKGFFKTYKPEFLTVDYYCDFW